MSSIASPGTDQYPAEAVGYDPFEKYKKPEPPPFREYEEERE